MYFMDQNCNKIHLEKIAPEKLQLWSYYRIFLLLFEIRNSFES